MVIVGSGISGAFAARALAREEGLDVLMLEAREACWGATGRVGCYLALCEQLATVCFFGGRGVLLGEKKRNKWIKSW